MNDSPSNPTVESPAASRPAGRRSWLGRLLDLYRPRTWREKGKLWASGLLILTFFGLFSVLAVLWSREPDPFDVGGVARTYAQASGRPVVVGYPTTTTLMTLIDTLLNKRGGYVHNDVLPPGCFLDNIPNWEFGVLEQIRDLALVLRNDFSRSQSQSSEDESLALAQTSMNIDSLEWLFPAAEDKYLEGYHHLKNYLGRLNDPNESDAQFYARADNLVTYLVLVEKRLGAYGQQLTAAVGKERTNTDLSGESGSRQSTPTGGTLAPRTPWMKIDDEFYKARGYTWALLHALKALRLDFEVILQKKNALASVDQIIRELEATQEAVWSPVILNGSGFGWEANHSLVMASYIARANAGIINLRELLTRG